MSLRNKDERDLATLERIVREGGFSLSWLISNRDNAASLHRLIASGKARFDGSDWISGWISSRSPPGSVVEIPQPTRKTWREKLRELVRRMPF
jgi:hypothetical protein